MYLESIASSVHTYGFYLILRQTPAKLPSSSCVIYVRLKTGSWTVILNMNKVQISLVFFKYFNFFPKATILFWLFERVKDLLFLFDYYKITFKILLQNMAQTVCCITLTGFRSKILGVLFSFEKWKYEEYSNKKIEVSYFHTVEWLDQLEKILFEQLGSYLHVPIV